LNILVTGGSGYIGSHTCLELLKLGHEIIVLDNFSNSKLKVVENIKKIACKNFKFYCEDICNCDALERIFSENLIDVVIHFAGLKSVSESILLPLKYYYNNVLGSVQLLKVMSKFNVQKLIFSSSATVYGNSNFSPIKEDNLVLAVNPYGQTKLMIENILKDFAVSNKNFSVIILRYFNPIGAEESGVIGEDPVNNSNNLLPSINKVAKGELKYLNVFGNDYNTLDGTGVRDYIHVVDLSIGHVKALEKMNNEQGVFVYNLGIGRGYSVLQVVKTFEDANDVKIPIKILNRRPGDVDYCVADPTLAENELNFKASKNIIQMCKDSWNFAKNNNN
jgi:UDP-glucose 4-epimerase